MAPEVKEYSGEYFSDCAVQTPFALARDEQLAEALTNKSLELVGAHSTAKEAYNHSSSNGLLETDL